MVSLNLIFKKNEKYILTEEPFFIRGKKSRTYKNEILNPQQGDMNPNNGSQYQAKTNKNNIIYQPEKNYNWGKLPPQTNLHQKPYYPQPHYTASISRSTRGTREQKTNREIHLSKGRDNDSFLERDKQPETSQRCKRRLTLKSQQRHLRFSLSKAINTSERSRDLKTWRELMDLVPGQQDLNRSSVKCKEEDICRLVSSDRRSNRETSPTVITQPPRRNLYQTRENQHQKPAKRRIKTDVVAVREERCLCFWSFGFFSLSLLRQTRSLAISFPYSLIFSVSISSYKSIPYTCTLTHEPICLSGLIGTGLVAATFIVAGPDSTAMAAVDSLQLNALSLPTWAVHVSSVVEWFLSLLPCFN
ncbi:hypothetical protein YC2023_036884 [Brassica napus]